MKMVKRNKQKMSVKYKQAKEYFKSTCKTEYCEFYGEIVKSKEGNMFWSDGGWCAVVYHSMFGETYNYY